MGLLRRWTNIHATTYRSRDQFGDEDGGEGDSAGGPKPARHGPNAWPTLIIEAGASQSRRELRNDMHWWFAASNHDVKIVILIKFKQQQRQILLEKWEELLPAIPSRPGAMTTRASAAIPAAGARLAPVLKQTITITQDIMITPPAYNVVGAPLVLSFELLFLRDPIDEEADFVVTIADLRSFGESAWALTEA